MVSNFIIQALSGEPITIYGKGEQTRSFCFVDDLIRGLILLIERENTGPINLGNPTEYSIQALAELIVKMTHSTSKLTYKPLPVDDPKVRCPDITLARTLLDWTPKIPIETGLQKTIEYFQLVLC